MIIINNKKIRLYGLDIIRGAALCSMLIYHACWDLVWIFHVPWDWYKLSYGAYLWQQSICWTFILLSGYCCHFSRNLVRRGLIVFSCGWLITFVTLVFMPGNRVLFGVLYLIGAAMILTGLLSRGILNHIPARLGLILNFTLFLLTKNIASGTLFSGSIAIYLPRIFYSNLLTAAFGFPYPGFFSTDYFPLIPWAFLFLTGYFLYYLKPENPGEYKYNIKYIAPLLSAMGRRSLLIYLLHQPIIYGVLWLVFAVIN